MLAVARKYFPSTLIIYLKRRICHSSTLSQNTLQTLISATSSGALMGNSSREPGKATVSLARIVIDAPPNEVYAKLSRAREWNDWLTTAKLIHTAQPESLQTGDTFCYTAKLAPGFIDAVVQDAEPNQVLHWGDKALFGLVRSQSRWQLRKQGGGARGLWLRKPRTLVTIDQEVTGPLSCIVTGKRLEMHTTRWLTDVKAAVEGSSVDVSKVEQMAKASEE